MRTARSSGASAGSPTTASSSAARPWLIPGDRTAPSSCAVCRLSTATPTCRPLWPSPATTDGDQVSTGARCRDGPCVGDVGQWHPRPMEWRHRRESGRERRRPRHHSWTSASSRGDTPRFRARAAARAFRTPRQGRCRRSLAPNGQEVGRAAFRDAVRYPAGRDVRQSFATLRGLTDAARRHGGRGHDGASRTGGGRPQLRLSLRLDPRHLLHRSCRSGRRGRREPCSTTQCAGSAPAYSRTESPRRRRTGATAALCRSLISTRIARLPRRLRCRRQSGPASVSARSVWRGASSLGERRLAGPPRQPTAGTPPSWPSGPSPSGPRRRSTGSGRSGPTTGPTAGSSASPACVPSPSTPHCRVTSPHPCRWPIICSARPIAPPSILRAVGSAHRAMHASTPPSCSPRFAGRSRPRIPAPWPPARPSLTSCARTTTSTATPSRASRSDRTRAPF